MATELPLNTTVSTPDPKIDVVGPGNRPLPPGKYTFQLTVVDSLEVESVADTVEVVVAGTPKASITASPASPVPVNRGFELDGSRSASPNGAIKLYKWTRTR
jgi:hypothetical protein